MSDQPEYTPEQFAAAASQIREGTPASPGTLPPESVVAAGAAASGLGATEVDVDKLMAFIAGLQQRVESLEAEKAAGRGMPLVGAAESLRDLFVTHAKHNPGQNLADGKRLADDVVDAAGNAVKSGDVSVLRSVTEKMARYLKRVDPGPGDHHYFRQAVHFAEAHLPDAMDRFTPTAPSAAVAAVGSPRGSVPVISGSVTG